MRTLRYNVAVSLDGFIAPPNGSAEWIINDPDIDFVALYADFDTFILGRKTFDFMVGMGDQNPLRNHPKESVIVVSRQMKAETHPNITIVADNITEYIKNLKQQEGKDIWLFGGGELAAPCFDAGLVDSVETAIMPVLLRGGTKMLGKGLDGRHSQLRLKLEHVKKMENSGILICRYQTMYQ